MSARQSETRRCSLPFVAHPGLRPSSLIRHLDFSCFGTLRRMASEGYNSQQSCREPNLRPVTPIRLYSKDGLRRREDEILENTHREALSHFSHIALEYHNRPEIPSTILKDSGFAVDLERS